MQAIKQWLADYQTNGVSLSLQELLLYRNRHHGFDLSPQHTIKAQLAGGYIARSKGRGMEFDEARHYQPGDDIRAIDWRVTARTGKTHTKIYREEKERPVFIVTDLSSSMQFGTQWVFKSIQAAHLSAALAWAATNRGDRVGGIVFNDNRHLEFKPVNRQKGVLALLNGLVTLHNQTTTSTENMLLDACARLRRLAHPGSIIYFISDFRQLSPAVEKQLQRLSRHCELVGYPISDPFEMALPTAPVAQQLPITNGQQEQLITLGDKITYREYQQQQSQYRSKIEERLGQCKCGVINVSAGEPLLTQVRKVP